MVCNIAVHSRFMNNTATNIITTSSIKNAYSSLLHRWPRIVFVSKHAGPPPIPKFLTSIIYIQTPINLFDEQKNSQSPCCIIIDIGFAQYCRLFSSFWVIAAVAVVAIVLLTLLLVVVIPCTQNVFPLPFVGVFVCIVIGVLGNILNKFIMYVPRCVLLVVANT